MNPAKVEYLIFIFVVGYITQTVTTYINNETTRIMYNIILYNKI